MKLDWRAHYPTLFSHCSTPNRAQSLLCWYPTKEEDYQGNCPTVLPLKGETDTAFFGERESFLVPLPVSLLKVR